MITWSDNYLMGIEQFDQEHKQIFKLAGQILERMRTWDNEKRVRMFVMREAIIYLNDYFQNHVRAEEAYMREIGYAGYAMHKALHDDFRKRELEKYRRVVDSGECRREDIQDFIGTGNERSFVLEVARMLYGEGIDSETDLIMSTLDIFGTNFWATLGRKFLGGDPHFTVSESGFLVGSRLRQEFAQLKPTTSVLFRSDMGLFYVASDAELSP